MLRWPQRPRIAGILCYDEYGLELSSKLCRALGLPGTSPELLGVLRDKHAFRRACADAGMSTVRHMACTQAAVESVNGAAETASNGPANHSRCMRHTQAVWCAKMAQPLLRPDARRRGCNLEVLMSALMSAL